MKEVEIINITANMIPAVLWNQVQLPVLRIVTSILSFVISKYYFEAIQ